MTRDEFKKQQSEARVPWDGRYAAARHRYTQPRPDSGVRHSWEPTETRETERGPVVLAWKCVGCEAEKKRLPGRHDRVVYSASGLEYGRWALSCPVRAADLLAEKQQLEEAQRQMDEAVQHIDRARGLGGCVDSARRFERFIGERADAIEQTLVAVRGGASIHDAVKALGFSQTKSKTLRDFFRYEWRRGHGAQVKLRELGVEQPDLPLRTLVIIDALIESMPAPQPMTGMVLVPQPQRGRSRR